MQSQEGIVEANNASGENDSLFRAMSHLQLAMESCQGSLTELEQWKSRAMTAELMNEQFAKTIDDCTNTIEDYEKQLANWKTRALLAEDVFRENGNAVAGGSGNYNVVHGLTELGQKESKSQSRYETYLRESVNEEKRDDILDKALMGIDGESCYSNLVSETDSTSDFSEPEFEANSAAKEIFRRRKWERHEMVKCGSTVNSSTNRSNSGRRGRRQVVSSND